jgi:SNF2 family DNA or RNA helicase
LVDECHRMKNNESQTSQAIRYAAQGAPIQLLLTGTPLSKNAADLFPLLNMLDPEEYNNYHRFCKRYCHQEVKYIGKQRKEGKYYGVRNGEELFSILRNKYMIRHTTEEVKSARGQEYYEPAVHIIPITVKTGKEYNEAEKVFGMGLNGGDNKNEVLGKLSKLRTKAWELKKKSSFEIIEDAFEQTSGKVVIYAHNKTVLADLKDYFKERIIIINGDVDTSSEARNNIIEEFRTNDKLNFIGISIMAGSEGLDGMQFVSSCLILLQEAWCPQIKNQIYGRLVNREGQTEKVTVLHVVAKGTVEEIFLKLYDKKEKVFKKIIDGEDFDEETGMNALFQYYKERYKEK